MARALTEGELLARAQAGDADAYAALVRAHQDIAFRTALLITQNAADAEEAAQDGFVKAWRALSRFREGAPLRPWLLTIVANEARNRRRSAGRRAALALRVAESDPVGASAETEITCSTWEMLSVIVSAMVCPTARSIPSRMLVAKFGALTVTRYAPSGSSSPRNRPSASVVRGREKFVPRFVMVTWAPANARPDGSLTIPSMFPVLAWD